MPDTAAPPVPVIPEKKNILIHVLEDGFTAHGRIWYRGQEIEYIVGDAAYKDTLDRDGISWLDQDDAAQMRHYRKIMFRKGPWPGSPYDNEKAAEEERKRSRKPPLLSPVVAGRR